MDMIERSKNPEVAWAYDVSLLDGRNNDELWRAVHDWLIIGEVARAETLAVGLSFQGMSWAEIRYLLAENVWRLPADVFARLVEGAYEQLGSDESGTASDSGPMLELMQSVASWRCHTVSDSDMVRAVLSASCNHILDVRLMHRIYGGVPSSVQAEMRRWLLEQYNAFASRLQSTDLEALRSLERESR